MPHSQASIRPKLDDLRERHERSDAGLGRPNRRSARTRRPPADRSQSHSVIAAAEATSGRRRPLADGVLHAYGLGCLRDPGSRAVGPGPRHERALPLIIDPCPDKWADNKRSALGRGQRLARARRPGAVRTDEHEHRPDKGAVARHEQLRSDRGDKTRRGLPGPLSRQPGLASAATCRQVPRVELAEGLELAEGVGAGAGSRRRCGERCGWRGGLADGGVDFLPLVVA
jgi:hypothetical protein